MQSGYRQQPSSYHSRPPGPPQGNSLLKIRTNCFKVTQIPAATYTLYDAFSPDIPKSAWKKRAELVRHLQKVVRPDVFTPQFLYDGAAIGFAHPTLCGELGIVRMFRVRLRDNAEPKPDDKGAVEIKFKQSSAEPISPTETNAVILQGQDSPRRSSILNFLQLVLRHASNNDHPNNGKAYFPPPPPPPPENPENPENRNKKKIKYLQSIDNTFLELRRGVFQPSMGQMIVVVDTVVAAFYQRGRMLDAMMAFFNLRRGNLRALYELSTLQLDNAGKFFRSVFIREEKGGVSGGRRTIKGFDRDGAHYQFTNSDGQEVTIEQHYQQVHNITLVHPKLPGVIVRTGDRKEILPMELCIIEPNQLFKKALPEVATREMVRFSTLRPDEKMVEIQRVSAYYQASESLVSAGMQVSRQPMDVDATQMQPPLIEFRGPPVRIREGKWNVVKQKLRKTTEGCHWGVINLAPTKLRSQAIEQHCMAFQKCAIDLGVALGIPIHMQQVDPQSDLIEALNKFMFVVKQKIGSEEGYQEMLGKRKFFILCFLEEEASRPRATLKHWGDIQTGVATQCVRLNKLPDLRNPGSASQYWNNVVLKVNPRLGGENSSVSQSSAFDKTFRNSGLRLPMIVGADVGHPSPGVRKPSVASLVYNIDPSALTYNALTALQDPRQEVIADLRGMMRTAIVDLQMRNQAAVTHIIFYRDGVSEGEYDQVKSIEIADIKNAINDVWNTSPNIQQGGFPKPKLTFIVVGKRHHTLLFPSNPAGGDRTGNCPAGVVVNTGITQPMPDIRDFYLLSHSAIIGTSRSSHYVVLLNEVFPGNTRILEELSYALCHVYAKATRSVSIPAPVYYADVSETLQSFLFSLTMVPDSLFAAGNLSTSRLELKTVCEQMTQERQLSGQTVPFDLDAWKAVFKRRNSRLDGSLSMYFL
ncbi:Piwi domain-containing protein [Ephemerocybe angulata]|uniref:Piwi domain-containing protein n=1 Tax=Ephemerocybe angulata TaxID=980116 RepID=A0A8H6MDI0_9AGAR|nr:Piwi domain-containing protein [Tulosesus angulatus]